MIEARRAERIRTLLGAQILFNNRNTTVDCQVRNISATGAKLAVTKTVTLPETFELYIPQKQKTHRVRLRWRYEDAVGVAFVDDTPPPLELISSRVFDGVTNQNRLAALELENAELRQEIARLTRKLEILRVSEGGQSLVED